MFGKSHGILGLAYAKLNDAYKMPGRTIPPHYTYNEIEHREQILSQFEAAGLVADEFVYTLRSMINMATANPRHPLNSGFLILGGGEEQTTHLYEGPSRSRAWFTTPTTTSI